MTDTTIRKKKSAQAAWKKKGKKRQASVCVHMRFKHNVKKKQVKIRKIERGIACDAPCSHYLFNVWDAFLVILLYW